MATSGMSYAVRYDLNQDSLLQDFSRMRIESTREQPALYVAMATWIPKCNMVYQDDCERQGSTTPEEKNISDNVSQSVPLGDPDEKTINGSSVEQSIDVADQPPADEPSDQNSPGNNSKSVAEKLGTSLPNDNNMDKTPGLIEECTKPTTSDTITEEVDSVVNTDQQQHLIKSDQGTPNDSSQSDNEEQENQTKSDPLKPFDGEKLKITPQKALSPKQLQKRMESEKKRQQKQLEREEREKKRLEEKERLRQEKLRQKQEKDEQKQKERDTKEEQKRKEREEKEQKRKEREEREEQKRKEREQEKLKRQQELEEKNKEKQKLEEQKQKAAAAFVNFFKKTDGSATTASDDKKVEEGRTSIFMPFEVKSDMRLAPITRASLSQEQKDNLEKVFQAPSSEISNYLSEIKPGGKLLGKSGKTWPYEDHSDDVVIVEEEFGETICEEKPKSQKMRAKFLKFHENRRPPYYGTWRKRSRFVKPHKPFNEDKSVFDYEVDSDDDWEEEEQGESLENNSEDEEKDPENENEDYEVDNDFFVPHGHLSDDEIDDESTAKLSPESLKCKLKLLQDEFNQDMQTKTHKIKPRSIGCVWYDKDGSNVDEAIDRHLRPLAIITNGQIVLPQRKKPGDLTTSSIGSNKKDFKKLPEDLLPAFLKLIHGNVHRQEKLVESFMTYLESKGHTLDMPKTHVIRNLKAFAEWKKCSEQGPKFNKYCWVVSDALRQKYNLVT